MRLSRKSCAARPWEAGRHTIINVTTTVIMTITVNGSKRFNIGAECERFKTAS